MANVDSIAVAPAEPDPTPRTGQAPRPANDRAGLSRVRALVAVAPAVLTDGAVIAFALFTVLYHLAFLGDLRPSVTFRIWLLACVVLAVVAVLRARRRVGTPADSAPAVRDEPVGARPAADRRLLIGVVVAAAVAAVSAGVAGSDGNLS
ncbi:hypothetical protein PSH25_006492, partial [Micromonospora sp. PSH25]|nr:hypothetical protein [Micromonospora foliorum]